MAEKAAETVDIEHFKNFWIEQQRTAKHMERGAALLSNSGSGTELFIGVTGRELKEKLFRETLFGTGDPESRNK